jgi:hypothetical protein
VVGSFPSTKNKAKIISQLKTELKKTKQKLQQESYLIDDLLYSVNYVDFWIGQNLTKPIANKIQTKIIKPLRKKHPNLTRQWNKE